MADESKLDEILGLVKHLAADQDEIRTEVARLQALNAGTTPPPPPTQIQRPMPRPSPAGASDIRHFDVETDRPIDPTMRAEMWRPDKIVTCPCGSHSYAESLTVVGEMDIMDAQHPKVDTEGRLMRQPYRFVIDPSTGQQTVPEQLRRTDETVEHFRSCNANAQAHDRRLQRFMKKKLASIDVDEDLEPQTDEHVARAAEFHQESIANG